MTTIRTPRLLLRGATTADLAAIHDILSDPVATAYWSTPPHGTLEQSRAWLESMIGMPPGQGEDFIVEHDGQVIGKVGLHRFPEIGYIFRPEVWGQGFASEALGPVLHRAFKIHGLGSIEADVDPRNEASLKLLARHGFRETGRAGRTLQIGEQWCDSVYLRLDSVSWRPAGPTAPRRARAAPEQ